MRMVDNMWKIGLDGWCIVVRTVLFHFLAYSVIADIRLEAIAESNPEVGS